MARQETTSLVGHQLNGEVPVEVVRESTLRDPAKHGRVHLMLHGEDSLLERIGRVVFENGDDTLRDDRTRIDARVNQMDGAATHTDPRLKRLPLRMKARKGRQERRMNVDDPVGEGVEHGGGDNPHKSCQTDPLHTVRLESSNRLLIPRGPLRERFARDDFDRDTRGMRALQRVGLRAVREHDGDFSGEVRLFRCIEERLKIRA